MPRNSLWNFVNHPANYQPRVARFQLPIRVKERGRAVFAAIKWKCVTWLISSMTQFIFYLAGYRMRVIKRVHFHGYRDFSDASLFLEHRPAIIAFYSRRRRRRRLPLWHRKVTTSVAASPFRYPREYRLIFREKLSNPASHIPKCRIADMPQIPPVIWSAIVSERAYGSLGGWSFAWWLTAPYRGTCVHSYTCSYAATAH